MTNLSPEIEAEVGRRIEAGIAASRIADLEVSYAKMQEDVREMQIGAERRHIVLDRIEDRLFGDNANPGFINKSERFQAEITGVRRLLTGAFASIAGLVGLEIKQGVEDEEPAPQPVVVEMVQPEDDQDE